METEANDPHDKRRKTEAHDRQDAGEPVVSSHRKRGMRRRRRLLMCCISNPTCEAEESHEQEPPPGAAEEGHDAVDRISSLPDEILGEIISFLPTTDGARTQALASRWRHLWLSAPLNIDHNGLPADEKVQANIISRILASHPGPARRFSISCLRMDTEHHAAMMDDWLRSPALKNLRELELENVPWWTKNQWLPASALRFSATLRVIAINDCHILDSMVETIRFPQLMQLGLMGSLRISVDAVHSIIAGCPNLECLLLQHSSVDSRSIRIKSPSIKSIGFKVDPSNELVIEDAPSLEKLFELDIGYGGRNVSVISAPKLTTMGGLNEYSCTRFTIGDTVIERLKASFKTPMYSIKFLAISNRNLSLDTVIRLMRCFPCLEKLSVQTSSKSVDSNVWRRKRRDLIWCIGIRLKELVLKNYRGIESQANFATFFIMNAKMLESVRFEGGPYKDHNKFIAEQHKLLELKKRASRRAQFHFKSCACYQYMKIKHVNDLSKADPYECIC